jgi:cytochrome c556
MNRNVPAVFLALALLFCGGQHVSAQTAPADVVKQRQDAMESLWRDAYRAIAATVRTDQPDMTLITTNTAKAGETLQKLATLFPPGTGRDAVPSTRAKPEIWSNRSEFEATLGALVDANKTLGDDAKARNVEKVKADWTNLAKACGGCHGGPTKSGGKFRFEKE